MIAIIKRLVGRKPVISGSRQTVCNYADNYYGDQFCIHVKNKHSNSRQN